MSTFASQFLVALLLNSYLMEFSSSSKAWYVLCFSFSCLNAILLRKSSLSPSAALSAYNLACFNTSIVSFKASCPLTIALPCSSYPAITASLYSAKVLVISWYLSCSYWVNLSKLIP